MTRWRDALPPEQKRRINHPSHWQNFCVFKNGKQQHQRHHPLPDARPSASGRPIYWPHDVVRRCAMAMNGPGSRDWYHLGRIGLEAAIANDVELIDLLDVPSPSGNLLPRSSPHSAPWSCLRTSTSKKPARGD